MLLLQSACWVLGAPPGQAVGRSLSSESPTTSLMTEPTANWKEGMGHHCKLNDMTTDEWQAIMKHRIYDQHKVDKYQKEADKHVASDNHKLKPMQHIADRVNSTLYSVLAFESCATSCDVRHWCNNPPCDLSGVTDALLQHISNFNMKDVWSSCHSGCSQGLRTEGIDACKASCQGQAKSPWFCQESCIDYQSKLTLFTPMDSYTKKLDQKTGFFDRDSLETELSEAKKEVTRLHSKLAKCESRQGATAKGATAMFANPHLAKAAAMARAVAMAAAPKAASAKAASNLMADVVHP